MKRFSIGLVCAACLAIGLQAQTPPPPPAPPQAPPIATVAPAATAIPVPTVAVAPTAVGTATVADRLADQIHKRVNANLKRHKGVTFNIGDDDEDSDKVHTVTHDEIPKSVVPIVAISVLALFGFPVAIVAVIMFSSWAKARSLHRTVQTLVEKGQPIPPELLQSRAGAPLRPWYDLRRGIVLLAVGTGIIMFFGIAAGWDEGVWALGLIPAIIGGGYILAWRLANKRETLLKQ